MVAVRSTFLRDKAIGTLAVATFFVAGYFGIGRSLSPGTARGLATSLDAAIPFLPWTVWIYLAVFPMAFLPVFVVRSRGLFARTMTAYAAVMAVSYGVFVAFPVTSAGLRADPATLDPTRISQWAVRALYLLDPPFNLFPSLHLSIAMLASLAVRRVRRIWGIAALTSAALIGVSICTVKQHFVVDGIAGAALAFAAHAAIVRPYRAAPEEELGYGPAGGILFLTLLGLTYAGFGVAFALS